MNSISYIHIDITGSHFSNSEHPEKPHSRNSARETLLNIESLINASPSLEKDSLEFLAGKAQIIHDRYLEKTQKLSFIRRFFGRVAQKEKEIQKIFERIQAQNQRVQNASHSPFISCFSAEVHAHIFSFLDEKELGRMTCTSRVFRDYQNAVLLKRARKYGYRGDSLDEAKHYIDTLLQGISTLNKGQYFPKYMVKTGRWPSRRLDASTSLENLWQASKENGAEWQQEKDMLDYALRKYAANGNLAVLKTLLILGADSLHQAEWGQWTPLLCAADEGNAAAIAFLLKQGARPSLHFTTTRGDTALHRAILSGNLQSVRLLVANGADLSTPDRLGRTALELAKWRAHSCSVYEIVKFRSIFKYLQSCTETV